MPGRDASESLVDIIGMRNRISKNGWCVGL